MKMKWSRPGRRNDARMSRNHVCLGMAMLVLSGVGEVTVAAAATVGPATPGGIQGALDSAANNDVIEVQPGVYSGPNNTDLDFHGRRVHLKSTAGPSSTVLDAQGNGRLFHFDSGEGTDTVVEGFTLRGGVAAQGGAILIDGASPTLRNNIFEGNGVTDKGGAIYALNSSLQLIDCLLQSNTASGDGAAVYLRNSDGARIQDSTFSSNRTQRSGGALACYDSNAEVSGAVFSGNTAGFKGGALYSRNASRPRLTDCLLENNTAGSGGAVYATAGGPRLEFCTLRGNRAGQGGALWAYRATSTRLIRCEITGNAATSGDGGGLGYFFSEGGEITNCRVEGNTATGNGGGIALDDQSRPALSGTLIADNTAGGEGGGLWGRFQVSTTLANCVLARNHAAQGGAAFLELGSTVDLDNTIVWGNSAAAVPGLLLDSGSTVRLDHSAYGSATDHSGNVVLLSSVAGDPRFVSATSGDYRLQSSSPCVDAGSDGLVPSSLAEDLDGGPRIQGGAVDIGAFEGTSVAVRRLTILSPNGGESFAPGGSIPIRWSSSGNVGNVTLSYSLDGGGSWSVITTTTNDGQHEWSAPVALTTRGRVRVQEAGGALADASDANFVIESLSSGSHAPLPYTAGFESGSLDSFWSTHSDEDGRVRVVSSHGPHGGGFHLTLDDATRGGYSTNQAWLRLDLSGHSDVGMSFWWKEFGDETHADDGVYFSSDGGSSFVKVLDLDPASSSNDTWMLQELDVDALASGAGLALNDRFVVKFQQYDNYPISSDGLAVDDVSVTAGAISSNTLTLLHPVGGESFDAGSSVMVTWNSTGSVGAVALDYSADGGSTWTAVSNSTLNDGAFDWTAPQQTTTQGRIRVREASGTLADVSDGNFVIADTTPPPPTGGYASLPYATGFESGLDAFWTAFSTAEGRIEVTTAHGPVEGASHLTMDDHTRGGDYSRNEAHLHLDLDGENDVVLDFAWKEFGDEGHAEDGVFFSDDGGTTFAKVLDLRGNEYANGIWQNFSLDVDELAAAVGLSLNSTFVVKFQQIDNYPIASDGHAFDAISVAAGNPGDGGDDPGDPPGGVTFAAESEANDSAALADGPLSNTTGMTGAIADAGDADWFFFETTSASTARIELSIGSSADLDYYLYDANEVQLGRQYTTRNPEVGSYFLNAGRYYVQVLGYRGATSDYSLTVTGLATKSVAGPPEARFALHANVPNPFNPRTRIAFELDRLGPVRLSVYDLRGQRVALLVDEVRKPGRHDVIWNGRDDAGRPVASGVYVYRLESSERQVARKMILIK